MSGSATSSPPPSAPITTRQRLLRLDPLLLAGAQASDKTVGVLAKLRREFGPEAHFSATEAGSSLFVMAARGGMENDVAASVRRRLAAIAPGPPHRHAPRHSGDLHHRHRPA